MNWLPELPGIAIAVIAGTALPAPASSHEAGVSLVTYVDDPRSTADPDWKVGMLRRDGLRIVVTGRMDASSVLDLQSISTLEARRAYRIAAQIPALLNHLYCWCGCHESQLHRSALACFEDEMAIECPVSQGTAQIAYELHRQGIRAPRAIQAAVDAAWRQHE